MPIPPDWSQNLTAFVNEWRQNKLKGDENVGDNPFDRFVLTEEAKSSDDFLHWVAELQGPWCFRGQREAVWSLGTSLDRGVEHERSSPNSSILYHLDRETETRELLHRFQQHAHSYLRHVPPIKDLGSWYALMQHHCVPTRLLDWTESPHVAMYFAVEETAVEKRRGQEEAHSAVWAIDLGWLEAKGRELLHPQNCALPEGGSPTEADYINSLLRGIEEPAIIRINPAMSSPRMFAQQGILLCKLLHQASFAQVLMDMVIHSQTMDRPVLRKIEIPCGLRIGFLKQLRAMNIHRASLFPGLDGLGISLRLDLELRDMGTRVTEPVPSLKDPEWALDQVHDCYKPLEELRSRLASLAPDSPARLDLLPEIAVAAEVLRAKLASLIAAIDAAEDGMPDD